MIDVTVVVPCFNQAHFLRRALDSVAGQDMADWEVVVIDDGSTDDTAAMARAYGDRRVRYVYQDNRGLSGARNTGIKLAEGRYLAFLDADDEWEPAFLGRCRAELEADPRVLGVYARNWFIDEQGRRLPQLGGKAVPPQDFRRRLLEGGFFPVHAALVRRTAMQVAGGFDEDLTSLEDWDLWLRLSEQGNMTGIPALLARYRVYPGSMSTDVERMHANRMAVLTKHFGGPQAAVQGQNDERAYAHAFAYRAAALGFLGQGRLDRCWSFMEESARTWPGMLARPDTYYELGCGRQQKGLRGRPEPEEIEANGRAILDWLDDYFSRTGDESQPDRSAAFGQAYVALAMLADQAGDWRQGRRYVRKALKANPQLARDPAVIRRALKMHLGKNIVESLRARKQTPTCL